MLERTQPPDSDYSLAMKREFYTFAAYLLTFSSYNYDNYIEFTKLSASVLYAGNYNKKCYNLHGRSNAGKSGFIDTLHKAVETLDSEKSLSNRYATANNQENNVNAAVLGRSLMANLDDPQTGLYASEFKKDCNISYVFSRPIHANERESYLITASMFVTSNDELQNKSEDDDGWNSRIYPIHLVHSFCELQPMVSRTRESSLQTTTNVLAAQMLTNKYPQGSAFNITRAMALSILNFYSKFYFHTIETPTSKTMSPTIASATHRYLSGISPYYNFKQTVKIVPSETPISHQQLNDLVDKWIQSKSQFNQVVKGGMTPTKNLVRKITNDINKWHDGNGKYFVSFIF
jgi:hypothetical protein